jgi:hypothetical protein
VNLAEAIGVTSWQDIRHETEQADVNEDFCAVKIANQDEVWCWDADLASFWDDDSDGRWVLLVAIVRAMGHNQEMLFPLDSLDEAPQGAKVLVFGGANQQMALPTLSDILLDARLKKQVWHALCAHDYLIAS